ncbi:formate--tetrahydrofolate ligase [Lactovum miscens]|uniref:Formate--tetrahydrofolate ligase n=1 Tax=Lactovum miscens TaxID=190387 RepID=A0A841CB19_9LACT|nr:formate--tetrahydrofolate ligase [Lactovum miscens]MBB5888589.1 formate--tetrahydrofolate ligase [Lactovum miscens]
MKTDIEIAEEAQIEPIVNLSEKLGILSDDIDLYGKYKAKISIKKFDLKKSGKLVLVTAINPTPAGEGKTTISIGLADALNQIGIKTVLALREPSMGPVFGMKGGATGGGYAQVVPMEDINLHFTGDLHAMTAANNLISAMLDNHLFQGNELNIDPERIIWHRVMDMNDRSLRDITIAQDGLKRSVPRVDHFDITVASEIMAIFCLATSLSDLKVRLSKILLAFDKDGKAITVSDLGITDAVALILKQALKPNLVQTLEGNAAFIHGGPFANIAHGCNSVLATQAALTYGDVAVTEAGFGADLGAEKFLDIKSRELGKSPDAVVMVVTVRSLKYNGGVKKSELNFENLEALEAGSVNLKRHINNLKKFGIPLMVAINHFYSDTDAEIKLLSRLIENEGVNFALADIFSEGSRGGKQMANILLQTLKQEKNFSPIYDLKDSIPEKIEKLAKEIYHADKVNYSEKALSQLKEIDEIAGQSLPVCIAKTQYSFSDNAKLLGAPDGFEITVREITPRLGAGFVVVYLGEIIAMPGLPKHPAALDMSMDDNGQVRGLS